MNCRCMDFINQGKACTIPTGYYLPARAALKNYSSLSAEAEFGNVPPVKKVIHNCTKTIVLWADGTKTIVGCAADESFDEYTGFCAAVVKKLYGSTSATKRMLKQVTKG